MARQPWRITRPLVFVLSLILVLEAMWIAPAPAAAMPARPAPQTAEAPLASPLVIPDTTLRVSESTDGDQGNGTSGTAYISADGRYVAFHSPATTLVDGDTNGVTDVFVRDTLTGETTRVSVSSAGVQGNGNSQEPSISGDGRYVVFQSVATNLVSGDTNAKRDIFVHDRATGATEMVSIDGTGDEGNGVSGEPVLSFDGRFVAFHSESSDLVAFDTNAKSDIFVHDRSTGTTERVSVDSSEAQVNGDSFRVAISNDASIIVFDSFATNLVASDTNAKEDIFVRDRVAGTTVRASVDSSEAQVNGDSESPSVSGDGRYIVFDSAATNLVASDTNAKGDIFVRDTVAGTTERVSVDSSEAQSNNGSQLPSVSDDGRYVTFNSTATNLVASDTNAVRDVFLRDRTDGVTERVSLGYDGAQGNGISIQSELAALDGRTVVFKSSATNLIVGDTNAADDVFIRQAADRIDETNLGLQAQHSFENWDLGAGDALGVNVGNGNLVLSHPIVSLPIEGSTLTIDLTYNSHDDVDYKLQGALLLQ